mmetsp:Transcript_18548/g.37157  ORF Transcript_18548/g.37157 Transcript_18548/m.37157 type:complete len:109 (-) Transcript_18548:93-419(-)
MQVPGGMTISFKKVQFGLDREENRLSCERELAAMMAYDDDDDADLAGKGGGYVLGIASWSVWRSFIGVFFVEVTAMDWAKALAGIMIIAMATSEVLFRLAKARGSGRG